MSQYTSKQVYIDLNRSKQVKQKSNMIFYGLIWSKIVVILTKNHSNESGITRSPGLVFRDCVPSILAVQLFSHCKDQHVTELTAAKAKLSLPRRLEPEETKVCFTLQSADERAPVLSEYNDGRDTPGFRKWIDQEHYTFMVFLKHLRLLLRYTFPEILSIL